MVQKEVSLVEVWLEIVGTKKLKDYFEQASQNKQDSCKQEEVGTSLLKGVPFLIHLNVSDFEVRD